jgi:CDP-paratose 2-epimerase
VYPTAAVNGLAFQEEATRYTLAREQSAPGASADGIDERFPLTGSRTFYGATKLASEMLLEEYAAAYELDYVALRCGVISGPGQMGKVEQGVFALWMARHLWGTQLLYKGWGATGKQVRDVLHVDDLRDLMFGILTGWDRVSRRTLNAGGGNAVSASLQEATAECQAITGRSLTVQRVPETHPTDVRIYVTNHAALSSLLHWRPQRSVRQIFADLHEWMLADETRLKPILAS